MPAKRQAESKRKGGRGPTLPPSDEFVAGRGERVAELLAETESQPVAGRRKGFAFHRAGAAEPLPWVVEKEKRIGELAELVAGGEDVRAASHVTLVRLSVRGDDDGRPTADGQHPGATAMGSEPGREVWRTDTPAADAQRAVTALVPADLAEAFLSVRLDAGSVRVALYPTDDPTAAKVSLSVPADGEREKVLRLLVLKFLHEAAAVIAGEKFAA